MKKEDIFMKTNDSWKSKGSKDSLPQTIYQRHLNNRLSEPKKYDDPYKNMKTTFRSSIGFKN